MAFTDLLMWVIAAAEGKKGMPLVPHIYALPILFLIGIGIGYWYRGKKAG
ncbi:MAG: hypothetical protein ACE5KK_04005 [Candidatus Brocadiales bacterium]